MSSINSLLFKINAAIINPLILLMFAVALVVFFTGIVKFIWNNNSEEAREKGKKNMIYGVIGIFIMVSVFGIIQMILGTFDVTPTDEAQKFLGK